jgi:hypothetical protein
MVHGEVKGPIKLLERGVSTRTWEEKKMERAVGRTRQSKSGKMKKSVRALEMGTPG